MLNRKSWKLKPRKLRNACIRFLCASKHLVWRKSWIDSSLISNLIKYPLCNQVLNVPKVWVLFTYLVIIWLGGQWAIGQYGDQKKTNQNLAMCNCLASFLMLHPSLFSSFILINTRNKKYECVHSTYIHYADNAVLSVLCRVELILFIHAT